MGVNHDIAKLLGQLADLHQLEGTRWVPASLRKAAQMIEGLGDSLDEIYKSGGEEALLALPTIGKGISRHIIEFLENGKMSELEELKKANPGLLDLLRIPGLGPKKVKKLYDELGLNTLAKLKNAAKKGEIQSLSGFGKKSEEEILSGISLLESSKGRRLIGEALPYARNIVEQLRALDEVEKAEIAGSLRRREETIGDIDFLVVSKKPLDTIEWFSTQESVKKIVAKGTTKCSVVLDIHMNADLRVVQADQWGAALQYFTGSKHHNVPLRQLAINKGLKLNEYGLFKGETVVASKTESAIYKKLGLEYVEPELRQNSGEIDAAKNGKLPKLIEYGSIRGDMHMHTTWSDGSNSTEEMINACAARGYEYMGISDHSKSQHLANGLDEKRLLEHIKEIRAIGEKQKMHVMASSEVDILKDGSLDYKDSTLAKMDYVIGSVHMGLKMKKEEATKRVLNALSNPHLNILGHPTGRLLKARAGYELDWNKVLNHAQDNGVLIEINAQPSRLDISAPIIRKCVEKEVNMIINTDSHSVDQLNNMEIGIAQARRGWASEKNIVNTNPFKTFQKYISKKA